MNTSWRLASLLLVLLLPALSAPALASDSLVIVRSKAVLDGDAVAAELELREHGTLPIETRDLKAFLVDAVAPVTLRGSVRTSKCSGAPTSGFADAINRASMLVDDLQFEAAILGFEEQRRSLPCLNEVAAFDDLVAMHFLMGVARYFLDERNKAFSHFQDALALDEDYPWDDTLSPLAQPLFEQARAVVKGEEDSRFSVRFAAAELAALQLDGRALEIGSEQGIAVKPGRHLLQWTDTEGKTDGLVMTVSPNQDVGILGRTAVESLFVDPTRLGGAAVVVRGILAGQAGERDIVFVDLVSPAGKGDAPMWVYERAGGNLRQVPTRKQSQIEAREQRDLDDRFGSGRDRVRIQLGGGWGVVAADLRTSDDGDQVIPQQHSFGVARFGFDLRLHYPLTLDLALSGTFDSNRLLPNERSARVLPELRIGLIAPLARARFQPSVGLAFLLGLDRPVLSTVVNPGLMGIIKADYLITRERGLFLRIEFAAGVVQVKALDSQGLLTRTGFPPRIDIIVGAGVRL